MLAQLTQPAVDPRSLSGAHPLTTALVMISTLAWGIVIASVYKWTHRGLSYSQAFQFSLVMLGMLGAGIMLVASTGVIPAIGIIGGFSLIRFRTPVKDPKDMAYILFTLVVGLAMGAQLYWVALIVAVSLCAAIIVLTRLNFGLTSSNESIVRVTVSDPANGSVDTSELEALLQRSAGSIHLLSAVGHGSRMELTYGIRPRRGSTNLSVLQSIREGAGVEHAELFDAKHQVEF